MKQAEAKEIRKRVLDYWLEVLTTLEWERQVLVDAGESLSKEFIDKSRICADQIRRDTKIRPGDQNLATDDDEPAEIPLQKLKLVS